MATTPVLYSTVVRTSRKSDGMCMFDEELNKALKCLKTFLCRVCRVKRMTRWLKSSRGNSVVHPRSLKEV